MTAVKLDLVVIQASVWDGRIRPVRFRPDGKTLVNMDLISIQLFDDGVVGLHLRLPGTGFDIVHRAINPESHFGPGAYLDIGSGQWVLHPTPVTSFDPLSEILTP